MADEKKTETAAEAAAPAQPSGPGFMAWLPLIVTILLMPALAYGVAEYVILPQLQQGLGIKTSSASSTKAKKEDPNAKKQSAIMNKLLVNVAGTMGARYLLCSLSVVGTGADFKDRIQEHDAQLRDIAQGTLNTKTLADLEKPGARNLIRTELMAGFNSVLGDSSVQDIYFTEFAIQ